MNSIFRRSTPINQLPSMPTLPTLFPIKLGSIPRKIASTFRAQCKSCVEFGPKLVAV